MAGGSQIGRRNGVKILVDAEIKHRAKKKETEDIDNQTGNSTAEQKVEASNVEQKDEEEGPTWKRQKLSAEEVQAKAVRKANLITINNLLAVAFAASSALFGTLSVVFAKMMAILIEAYGVFRYVRRLVSTGSARAGVGTVAVCGL